MTGNPIPQTPAATPAAGLAPAAPEMPARRWSTLVLRLAPPALLLGGALLLPSFMLATNRPFRGTGLGPAAWPRFVLGLVAACCAVWLVQTAYAWLRGRLAATASAAEEAYSYPKAVAGLVVILAYGWAVPWIGFGLATALFVAVWCLIGGVRNPLAVIPISLVGTGLLLWVFMGLARMPLHRGQGVFDSFSIALLRALGIY